MFLEDGAPVGSLVEYVVFEEVVLVVDAGRIPHAGFSSVRFGEGEGQGLQDSR